MDDASANRYAALLTRARKHVSDTHSVVPPDAVAPVWTFGVTSAWPNPEPITVTDCEPVVTPLLGVAALITRSS